MVTIPKCVFLALGMPSSLGWCKISTEWLVTATFCHWLYTIAADLMEFDSMFLDVVDSLFVYVMFFFYGLFFSGFIWVVLANLGCLFHQIRWECLDGWEWNVTYFGVILLNFDYDYDWIEGLKIHGFVTVPTLFDGLGIQHDRIFSMRFLPRKKCIQTYLINGAVSWNLNGWSAVSNGDDQEWMVNGQ